MRFLILLKRLAAKSNHKQHKLSCLIVRKGIPISFGYNSMRTHPASSARYNSLHAEQAAIMNMTFEEAKGCVAYIFRERKDGTWANSRPCPGCYEALQKKGIKRIIYTVEKGYCVEDVA